MPLKSSPRNQRLIESSDGLGARMPSPFYSDALISLWPDRHHP